MHTARCREAKGKSQTPHFRWLPRGSTPVSLIHRSLPRARPNSNAHHPLPRGRGPCSNLTFRFAVEGQLSDPIAPPFAAEGQTQCQCTPPAAEGQGHFSNSSLPPRSGPPAPRGAGHQLRGELARDRPGIPAGRAGTPPHYQCVFVHPRPGRTLALRTTVVGHPPPHARRRETRLHFHVGGVPWKVSEIQFRYPPRGLQNHKSEGQRWNASRNAASSDAAVWIQPVSCDQTM